MKKLIIHAAILSLLAFAEIGNSQDAEKPLTDQDIQTLIKQDLSERLIILKIRNSKSNFDTSPETLGKLKENGVSDNILEAMIEAGGKAPSTGTTNADPEARPAPSYSAGTVYLISGTIRKLVQRSGRLSASPRPFPFVPHTVMKAKFEGPRAPFRISDREPTFEVALPADLRVADNVFLIRPRVEKDEREFEWMRAEAYVGPRPGKVTKVELAITEVKDLESAMGPIKIYHIKSAQPLTPGEYVLSINLNTPAPAVHGQPGNYYDFGVDAAPSTDTSFDKRTVLQMKAGQAHFTEVSIAETKELGVVTTMPVPPRSFDDGTFIPRILHAPRVAPPVRIIDQAKTRLAGTQCAVITECDGQEYELLVISPEQTPEGTGQAAYRVILWNKAGIDWYAEVWLDVAWESAKKPYATVVYRNTKEDSCLFVENGSTEGSWKVAQQMMFGKGAPAKEHVARARPLESFRRHRSSAVR